MYFSVSSPEYCAFQQHLLLLLVLLSSTMTHGLAYTMTVRINCSQSTIT